MQDVDPEEIMKASMKISDPSLAMNSGREETVNLSSTRKLLREDFERSERFSIKPHQSIEEEKEEENLEENNQSKKKSKPRPGKAIKDVFDL